MIVIEPESEWIVHFIWFTVSKLITFWAKLCVADLDVWKIGPNHTVHHTPDMRRWVFVTEFEAQLIPNKAFRALAAEETLGSHCFRLPCFCVLDGDLKRVFGIDMIAFKARNLPWSLDADAMLAQIVDENTFNEALM